MGDAHDDMPRDERAERRESRRRAARERMRKHGVGTGRVYRDAILKRMRKNAGTGGKGRKRRR